MATDKPASRYSERGRVEAFSDGVFAIAITLLVLDLRPPEQRGSFAHDLFAEWPSYVAYLAAFVIIGAVWQNHHALFSRITRVDTSLLGRNMIVLLFTSVLPFPTAVVSSAWRTGDRNDRIAALALFGLLSVALSWSWIWMCRYLRARPELLEDLAAAVFVAAAIRRSGIAITMTVVAFAMAFVSPVITLLLYAVTPIFYIVTLHRFQASHPG